MNHLGILGLLLILNLAQVRLREPAQILNTDTEEDDQPIQSKPAYRTQVTPSFTELLNINTQLKNCLQMETERSRKLCVKENKWWHEAGVATDHSLRQRTNYENSELSDDILALIKSGIIVDRMEMALKENPDGIGTKTCVEYKNNVKKRGPFSPFYRYTNCQRGTGIAEFWVQIEPELRLTFDYILYSEEYPNEKYNKLWYLVAFLKQLVMLVPNPAHVAMSFCPDCKEIENEIDELVANCKTMEEGIALLKNKMEVIQFMTLAENIWTKWKDDKMCMPGLEKQTA